jgi:hypothetical protein
VRYFNVETCQLLEHLGCVSGSEKFWVNDNGWMLSNETWTVDGGWPPEQVPYPEYLYAFTFEDLCAKTNAVRIWGDHPVCPNCEEAVCDCNLVPSTAYHIEVHNILDVKLNGGDYANHLLDHLKGKK